MTKAPKFRLVTLLLVIALFAMALGWWQDWHRRQSPIYLHILIAKTYVGEETTPPKCVATILVPSHGQFDAQFPDYRSLSGSVTASPTGAYQLDMNANFRSGFSYSGPIELDTITAPTMVVFSGVVYPYSFAMSRNKNGQSLLDKPGKTLSEQQALYEK